MPQGTYRKKKVTGRYQLQFPVAWVQRQLRGRTAELWRAEILRAFEASTAAMRAEWKASFVAQKGEMMKTTLTVEGRSGRRFDREAYCKEAQVVYGMEVADDASPKLLARCFQHSVDFIVQRGLISGTAVKSPAATSYASADASGSDASGSDVSRSPANEDFDVEEDLPMDLLGLDSELVSISADEHALAEHASSSEHAPVEHTPVEHTSFEHTLLEPAATLPSQDCVCEELVSLGDVYCPHGTDDDDLLFDHDHLGDMLLDSLGDPALQMCDPWAPVDEVHSPTHSSAVPSSDTALFDGFQNIVAPELTTALQQRDEALQRCRELQAQVYRLKIERDALWGSGASDDIFECCFR